MSCIQTSPGKLLLTFLALAMQQALAAEVENMPSSSNLEPNYTATIPARSDTNRLAANTIRRLSELYDDARLAGMPEEALMLAKQIVAMSIEFYGRDSKDTAEALTSLGSLQAESGELVPAIQNLGAAIQILERVENRLSMELLYPLHTLGNIQLQAGDSGLAKTAWTRAIHISHVNLGPHNYAQIESLLAIADLYAVAEMRIKEKKMRRRIRYLIARETGPAEEARLPAATIGDLTAPVSSIETSKISN